MGRLASGRWLFYTVLFMVFLALGLVMLGAYTRLTNAGLGCPDWPLCYGQLVLPAGGKAMTLAQGNYPNIPIEAKKAWTEMAHRYVAGTLALLIFVTGFCLIWRHARKKPIQAGTRRIRISWVLPASLMVLVLLQAALGMWTVTMKLLPVVVMGHLLGGILVFALLCLLCVQLSGLVPANLPAWRFGVGLGLLIIFCQIALGGWVSANYAGIACIGFPQCNGSWLPTLHLSEGFHLFSPAGANYQGGILDNQARVTIQFIHRLGAVITLVYSLGLCLSIGYRIRNRAVCFVAWGIVGLVVTQCILGIINVLYLLPIESAVAHNGVAAMLFASMLVLGYLTRRSAP